MRAAIHLNFFVLVFHFLPICLLRGAKKKLVNVYFSTLFTLHLLIGVVDGRAWALFCMRRTIITENMRTTGATKRPDLTENWKI